MEEDDALERKQRRLTTLKKWSALDPSNKIRR